MKNYLFVLIACVLSFNANAQLSSVSVSGELPKSVGVLNRGFLMMTSDSTFFAKLNSTNKFDDDFNVFLGETKGSTVKTAEDLAELVNSTDVNNVINFSTCDGKYNYSAAISEIGGEKNLIFKTPEYFAGAVSLGLQSIDRIPGLLMGELDPRCLDYRKGENVLGSYKSGGGDVLWNDDQYSIGVPDVLSSFFHNVENIVIGSTVDEAFSSITELIGILRNGDLFREYETSFGGYNHKWSVTDTFDNERKLYLDGDLHKELTITDLQKIFSILNGEKVEPTWR